MPRFMSTPLTVVPPTALAAAMTAAVRNFRRRPSK